MPIFHIRQGLKAGEEVDLQTRRITIGRSPHNTLVLPDESVDAAHASLEQRGDRWILQDLGTPGGTWLNDDVINKPCSVFGGDVIMLGKIRVEVQGVGRPDERLLAAAPVDSVVQRRAVEQICWKRLYILLGIGGGVVIGALIVLFLLGQVLFETLSRSQRNEPPVLNLILTDQEIVASPREKVIFFTEVEDQEDLDRVEFWVNDVLQVVKKPMDADVVKMKTRHQWSTDQPETYILSVIAYDKIGQSSEMIKILVKVQEP